MPLCAMANAGRQLCKLILKSWGYTHASGIQDATPRQLLLAIAWSVSHTRLLELHCARTSAELAPHLGAQLPPYSHDPTWVLPSADDNHTDRNFNTSTEIRGSSEAASVAIMRALDDSGPWQALEYASNIAKRLQGQVIALQKQLQSVCSENAVSSHESATLSAGACVKHVVRS